jgi:hypothetical protein
VFAGGTSGFIKIRVVRRKRTLRKLLSICCYLEDYRARVGTLAARTSWAARSSCCTAQRNGRMTYFLLIMILCAMTLAVLLVTGGVEKNPGSGMEAENKLQFLCNGYDRNLKSEIQCDTCGFWDNNNCGKFKAHLEENGKSVCDNFSSERLRLLEEKLRMLYFTLTIYQGITRY